jgi:hypothetical protein
MEIRCHRKPWDDGIEMAVFVKNEGRMFVGQPLALDELKPGEMISEPTVRMTNDVAQGLMDELWRCGLRPSEGTGSAGSLAATERHLKDMQAIAKGLLKKDGVTL